MDGLGRSLYVIGEKHDLGEKGKYHPFTGKPVADDFIYPHPGGNTNDGVLFFFIAMFVWSIAVGASMLL